MICLLTARRLKPGSWEQFRRAWGPEDSNDENVPPGFVRAYHLRNVRDEDEVISFGLFDATIDEFRAWRAEHEQDELGRQDHMAAFVENTPVDGMYEVIEEFS